MHFWLRPWHPQWHSYAFECSTHPTHDPRCLGRCSYSCVHSRVSISKESEGWPQQSTIDSVRIWVVPLSPGHSSIADRAKTQLVHCPWHHWERFKGSPISTCNSQSVPILIYCVYTTKSQLDFAVPLYILLSVNSQHAQNIQINTWICIYTSSSHWWSVFATGLPLL